MYLKLSLDFQAAVAAAAVSNPHLCPVALALPISTAVSVKYISMAFSN